MKHEHKFAKKRNFVPTSPKIHKAESQNFLDPVLAKT